MDAHGFTVDCVHGELLAERQAVIGRTRQLKRCRETYMVRDMLGKAEEVVSAGFLHGKGFRSVRTQPARHNHNRESGVEHGYSKEDKGMRA
jgi:hypothetical protein